MSAERADYDLNRSYETLVAALREWGIRYLAPTNAKPGPTPIPPAELIARLADHPHPRLRLALIPLFIRHPNLAESLPSQTLTPAARETLHKLYMAAVCLQRMWHIRLSFYLENQTPLPNLFSEQLGLPRVTAENSKICLHMLAGRETFNQFSAYEGVMDLFFEQLKLEARNEPASPC
ncbi:MAG: hypothetical protein ACE5GO_10475 [Anaerolineales bacterium]